MAIIVTIEDVHRLAVIAIALRIYESDSCYLPPEEGWDVWRAVWRESGRLFRIYESEARRVQDGWRHRRESDQSTICS